MKRLIDILLIGMALIVAAGFAFAAVSAEASENTAYPAPIPPVGEQGHICDIAPWMQPDLCDEYFAEPEPAIVLAEFIIRPVVIQPITARLMSGYNQLVR